MKKIEKNCPPPVKAKNPTTNYQPESHKDFCVRCYLHNNGCPNTGGIVKDRECRI